MVSREGRELWEQHLGRLGIETLRVIDRLTRANPVFIVSGFPGTVGSAACDIWNGLVPFLEEAPRQIAVWPFEGDLGNLSASSSVVVGEIYPRAAYGVALSAARDGRHRPVRLEKRRPIVRRDSLDELSGTAWVREYGIRIADRNHALDSDDAFDALMSAAALMRCLLEGTPLGGQDDDPLAEGGILGCGSLVLESPAPLVLDRPRRASRSRPPSAPRQMLQCPIPECDRVFKRGRSGWDAHVASPRRHPNWRPGDAASRKDRFRREYPGFFS